MLYFLKPKPITWIYRLNWKHDDWSFINPLKSTRWREGISNFLCPIFFGGVQGGREGSIISFNSYTKCGEMDVKEISTIFIEKHRKSVLQFNFDSFLHYTRAWTCTLLIQPCSERRRKNDGQDLALLYNASREPSRYFFRNRHWGQCLRMELSWSSSPPKTITRKFQMRLKPNRVLHTTPFERIDQRWEFAEVVGAGPYRRVTVSMPIWVLQEIHSVGANVRRHLLWV